MQIQIEKKQLPDFNKKIKFKTIVGWLIGERKKIYFSNGIESSFFISDKIESNKHWTTFIEKEIYEWEYVN
jgi:hypothetical protein